MKFEDLTPEQQEKAKGIKTAEEAMAFIKEEGLELTEEELEQVAGGGTPLGGKEHHYIWD